MEQYLNQAQQIQSEIADKQRGRKLLDCLAGAAATVEEEAQRRIDTEDV